MENSVPPSGAMETENAEDSEPMIYEDILKDIGGYGFFQRLFTVMTIVPQMTAAMIILSPKFTVYRKHAINCTTDSTPLIRSETNEKNLVLFTYLTIHEEWGLECSPVWLYDTVVSCQIGGAVTGALLSSFLSSRYGRVKGYMFVTCGMGILGMFPALAFDPLSFAVLRFLAGMGTGGCLVTHLVHLMEFITPEWRTLCIGGSFWPVGKIVLALLSLLDIRWRILTALCAAPAFMVVIFFPYIQESPRWLLTRRRTDEAYEVICKVANWNSKPAPAYKTIQVLQDYTLAEDGHILKGVGAGVREIVGNRKLCLNFLIVIWATVGCCMSIHGLKFHMGSLSGNPSLDLLYAGLLDLIAFPAVYVLNDRLGRRKTYIVYTVLSSVFLVGLIFASIFGPSTPAIMALSLLCRITIIAARACLTCTILESFPTTIRSSCLGVCVGVGYLGAVATPHNLLNGVSPGLSYGVYAILLTTSLALILLLEETNGKPLEDTMFSKIKSKSSLRLTSRHSAVVETSASIQLEDYGASQLFATPDELNRD